MPHDCNLGALHNASPKIRGPSPNKIGGPKHAKFGTVSYNFRLRSRISPERVKISKIGRGLHGLICKQTSSKTARHHAVNDPIALALTSAGIPVSNEPPGLNRRDGKRPDGLTLILWQGGKPVCWDVTLVSTLADSYLHMSAETAGGAADLAAYRKEAKYSDFPSSCIFQPLAFETLGPLSVSTTAFVTELGRRLSQSTDDSRESFSVSVAIQRFNSVLLQETFDFTDGQPDL